MNGGFDSASGLDSCVDSGGVRIEYLKRLQIARVRDLIPSKQDRHL